MRIKSLEKILNKKYCLLTESGCTALYILIKSLGIRNKTILIPANICYDVVLAILFSGNSPEIIDIDHSQCLSFNSLIKFKKKRNVGAIIYPYMYGNYGNVFKVKKFAAEHKIFFIEDIAPSLGSKVIGKYTGGIAKYSILSFGIGKIIDMKTGGSLNVDSKELFIKAKKNYLRLKKYSKKLEKKITELNQTYLKIINGRINNQVFSKKKLKKFKNSFIFKNEFDKKYLSILNRKISNIDRINDQRNKKASIYRRIISHQYINFLKHKKGAVYWRQNAVLKEDRDELVKFLNKKNIYARKFFPCLNKVFPFFKKTHCNISEKYERSIVNFWVGQEATKKDILKINNYINDFFYLKYKS